MKGSGWKLGAKWYKCPNCGKESPVRGPRGGLRRKHFRGCTRGAWHRNALSGADVHR